MSVPILCSVPISIHVPAWGTTQTLLLICSQRYNFNPRSRVGNDVGMFNGLSATGVFQSTFPRGERRKCRRQSISTWNFNPRSRVGNDDTTGVQKGVSAIISIHVPAWGTTYLPMCVDDYIRISIHVPAWGTTLQASFNVISSVDFNPRSRVGNDLIALGNPDFSNISIHVPAWGTTLYAVLLWL